MGEVHVDEDHTSAVVCYTDEAGSGDIHAALEQYVHAGWAAGALTYDPTEGIWTVVLTRKVTGS